MSKNKTFDQIKKNTDKINKKEKRTGKNKIYISRTKLGFCKNDGCNNARRQKSAYCGKCK